jgi:hypothetical protein
MLLVSSFAPSLFSREFEMLLVVTGLVSPVIIETHRFVEITESDHAVCVSGGGTRFEESLHRHSYSIGSSMEV